MGNPTNWVLTGNTAATWETLVGDYATLQKPITVNTVRAVNTTGAAISAQLRIADNEGNNVAIVQPATSVAAGEVLEIPTATNGVIVLKDNQNLEFQADATGMEVSAFGEF